MQITMLTCPNKQDPNWIDLEKTLGEQLAYDVYNTHNGEIPILGVAPNGEESILYNNLQKYQKEDAKRLWYLSKTKYYTNLEVDKDINGEVTIEDLLNSQIYKPSQYESSTSQAVNNVISKADDYAKETLINFANRARAFGNSKVVDVVHTLEKLDINKEIGSLDLANLADALTSIFKYNDYVISHPVTETNRGGLVEQLARYANVDIDLILADPKLRSEFWKFLSYAKTFIDGFRNVELLQSIEDGSFTEEEKLINDVVKQIQNQSATINNITSQFNTLLERASEASVIQFTSNPEIILGLRELFEITDDESNLQLWLDAMADTHVPFIANLVKKFTLTMTNAQVQYIQEQKQFADILRKSFGVSDLSTLTEKHFYKYFQTDSEGKPIRKLKQKYDYDRYYKEKKAFFESVKHLKTENRKAYIKKVQQWYKDNEKIIVSESEIKDLIERKREELPLREFNKWLYKNIYIDENGIVTVKMGDHVFKEPADKYIIPEWNDLQNDELYNYMVNTLATKFKDIGKETLFEQGYIPTMSKEEKEQLTYIESIEAWYEAQGANKVSKVFAGENDQIIRMLTIPMVQQFTIEEPIEYRKYQKKNESYEDYEQSVLEDIALAGKGEFNTIQEVKDYNAKVKQRNEEYASGKQNYNLYEVINSFIKQATIYKHKADMKYEYDLALHQIKNMQFNKRNGANKLITNSVGSKVMGNKITQTKSGEGSNLEKHFDEWLDAIFYGNFDIDEGTRTKLTNILLKYVSAKNMWLNLTAGISNMAYNRAQIRAESAGGYYYDKSDLFKADSMYVAAMTDMLSNTGRQERNTMVGAIVELFDITQNTNEKDYASGMLHKKLMSSDTFYLFNNIGEHYSQNIPLLAMLHSHRVINGEIVSINDFKYSNYRDALNNILSSDKKLELDQYWSSRMKNEEFKDGKKDYLRDFILSLDKTSQQQFVLEKERLDKEALEKFEKYPRAIDIFSLDNGIAKIEDEIEIDGVKHNVKLSQFGFADFRNKVANLNRKNNGIYNKEDSAILARRAIGKLILQFRKYMRPSWNKRFGSKFGKSFWNEQRKEWDKGSYVSLFQLVYSPFKDVAVDREETTMFTRFFTRMMEGSKNLATNSSIYWNTLDDFEKANVRRAITEMAYLIAVVMVGKLLSKLKPEDEDDETFAYNLMVYQTDRLMSELMFYTPIGMINEGQKILRSPFAAQSALVDIAKFTGSLVAYPFQSDERRIYQTGMYRDEYRLKVNTIKLIPVLNKYQQLERLNKFNKYYILFRG